MQDEKPHRLSLHTNGDPSSPNSSRDSPGPSPEMHSSSPLSLSPLEITEELELHDHDFEILHDPNDFWQEAFRPNTNPHTPFFSLDMKEHDCLGDDELGNFLKIGYPFQDADREEDISIALDAAESSGSSDNDTWNGQNTGYSKQVSDKEEANCTVFLADLESSDETDDGAEREEVSYLDDSSSSDSEPPDEEPLHVAGSRPRISRNLGSWVTHNTPLLQEYSERTICPPLVDRVDVKLDPPCQFMIGAFQMLANRDKPGKTADSTRRLQPQLLDAYTDTQTWAAEYLRVRYDLKEGTMAALVPTLLVVISNSFYEAHMRLMDDITAKAMSNMTDRNGACLEVDDFAFGLELRVAQELPFFFEANHRLHETLYEDRPFRKRQVASVPDTSLPLPPSPPGVTTRYGRRIKLSKAAQQLSENKEEYLKVKRVSALKRKNSEEGKPEPKPTPGKPTTGRPKKRLPSAARRKLEATGQPISDTSAGALAEGLPMPSQFLRDSSTSQPRNPENDSSQLSHCSPCDADTPATLVGFDGEATGDAPKLHFNLAPQNVTINTPRHTEKDIGSITPRMRLTVRLPPLRNGCLVRDTEQSSPPEPALSSLSRSIMGTHVDKQSDRPPFSNLINRSPPQELSPFSQAAPLFTQPTRIYSSNVIRPGGTERFEGGLVGPSS